MIWVMLKPWALMSHAQYITVHVKMSLHNPYTVHYLLSGCKVDKNRSQICSAWTPMLFSPKMLFLDCLLALKSICFPLSSVGSHLRNNRDSGMTLGFQTMRFQSTWGSWVKCVVCWSLKGEAKALWGYGTDNPGITVHRAAQPST